MSERVSSSWPGPGQSYHDIHSFIHSWHFSPSASDWVGITGLMKGREKAKVSWHVCLWPLVSGPVPVHVSLSLSLFLAFG